MATRKETLSELSSEISKGNISDAYRTFEDLPIVDQIAVSVSPGVGDALAAYEVKEFASRGKKNIEDKDYLGATGNYGMSALSGISLIPLFRLLRLAKPGSKALSKAPTKIKEINPIEDVKDPLSLPAPVKNIPPVPKVDRFVPSEIKELEYTVGLNSKARKWINGYAKDSPGKKENVMPLQDWVTKLKNSKNVPDGELRLLRIIDDFGDIHPKLLVEATSEGKDVSRKFIDNYMSAGQNGALDVRKVPKDSFEGQGQLSFGKDSEKTNSL